MTLQSNFYMLTYQQKLSIYAIGRFVCARALPHCTH